MDEIELSSCTTETQCPSTISEMSSIAGSGRRRRLFGNLHSLPEAIAVSLMGCVGAAALFGFLSYGRSNHHSTPPMTPQVTGVNLGGWLVLEDWFFSGTAGIEVGTGRDVPQGQGLCLPPHVTQLNETWPSEGILTWRLNHSFGPARTAEIFMSHRRAYVGNDDLEIMSDSGIQSVRMPITWAAFADALIPVSLAAYGSHDPRNEATVVPDPFYTDSVGWVTVPRSWLRMFIKKAAGYNLKLTLDIHAFPGGNTDGTFNGIWPLAPKFWTEQTKLNKHISLKQTGLWVVQSMISWLESLNPDEFKAIGGVCLMNEPSHLSWGRSWAPENETLAWLEEAAGMFRSSSLPRRGVKLYLNLIETGFSNFLKVVQPWIRETFTQEELETWMVTDIHWYTAWSGSTCSGRTVPGGRYFCDEPLDVIRNTVRQCASSWARNFEFNFPGLRAISEFSLGTYHEAMFACTDPATQRVVLQEQLLATQQHGIEHFFWTWRMPYGPAFEPGWSLKRILGREVAVNPFPCVPPHRPASQGVQTV